MAYYNGNKIISNGRVDFSSPYYEFAKSEYEKQLNIISGEYLEYGTYRVYIGYTNKLKPNTTYTISTTNNKPQNNGYNIYICRNSDKTQIQQINTDYGKGLTKSTFTTSNDIIEGETYYIQFSGTYEGLTVSNPCLVEGTSPMSLPYYGSILRPVDIEPVLLWKNGNPNAIFNEQTISTLDMSKFKHLIFAYKSYATGGYISYDKVDYVIGVNISLFCLFYAGGTMYQRVRRFNIKNSMSITFESAHSNNEIDDLLIVPIAIYGVNY